MSSSFHDDTFLEADDLVGVFDGGESVSNYDNSLTRLSVFEYIIKGCLDEMFRLGIESTGSFIQEQDLWFTDKSTGDCDSLFLSTRKFEASFTYESFISFWEDVLGHNEVVGIRLFGSLIKHFLCCFFWQTIFDVLSN